MQSLLYVLHFENCSCNGIAKLMTMAFLEGLLNAKKKRFYNDDVKAKGSRQKRHNYCTQAASPEEDSYNLM